MASSLTELKRIVFSEMLDLAGRVFILVRHADDVSLGKRVFTPDEREKGITLVFNKRMRFAWNENGIVATLVFGTTRQECFIPARRILSIFSPELNAQFSVAPEDGTAPAITGSGSPAETKEPPGKIVRVDFTKKK